MTTRDLRGYPAFSWGRSFVGLGVSVGEVQAGPFPGTYVLTAEKRDHQCPQTLRPAEPGAHPDGSFLPKHQKPFPGLSGTTAPGTFAVHRAS